MKDILVLPLGACTLDHDGCVVCADAGIPVVVIAVDGDDALCQDAVGNQGRIAVELVVPVRVGDGLLTHGGVAIGRIDGPLARREEDAS
ncbi:MAG TPA: HypC/HybG/HupF family hydrogenase formation chaperone [Chloroflexota bacterium]|jgi:hydrogenase expression/formation protein HypC|nr:HypC/HybG/HupF family hydrogenase formation chaperone [Chloroflexota bacterium]